MIRPLLAAALLLAGCGRLAEVGRAPAFDPLQGSNEHHAIYSTALPEVQDKMRPADDASLWSTAEGSLLGNRRAARRGDILTVVIEIDDRAEISNSSGRAREGSERMGIPELFGLPQRADASLPGGASLARAVETSSASRFRGEGSVRRSEKLTLRIAATVVERLANGVLHIEGSQQVRVNHELRDLVISGYIRPEDISRQNEISYDRIAGARISYGGRGLVSAAQTPRYGQEIADILLPF